MNPFGRLALGCPVSVTNEGYGFCRRHLVSEYGSAAVDVPLLYGGSVKGSNAAEIFAVKDVNGAFGGASLLADDFSAIMTHWKTPEPSLRHSFYYYDFWRHHHCRQPSRQERKMVAIIRKMKSTPNGRAPHDIIGAQRQRSQKGSAPRAGNHANLHIDHHDDPEMIGSIPNSIAIGKTSGATIRIGQKDPNCRRSTGSRSP